MNQMHKVEMDNKKYELTKSMDCFILGRLAVDEENFPGGEDNEPVTLMRNGSSVMFFVKPLSAEPSPIKKYYTHTNGNLYIGLDHAQPNTILNDPTYGYKNLAERIDDWRQRLEGKLLLFKPKIRFPKQKDGQPFLNLEIVSIEGEIEENTLECFLAIPKVNLDPKVFEARLLNGKEIAFDHYYHYMPDPQYVICGDYIYFNFKHWAKHSTDLTRWSVDQQATDILKAKLDFNQNEFYNYVVSGTEGLEFISEEGEMILHNRLSVFAEPLSIHDNIIPIEAIKPIEGQIKPSITPMSSSSMTQSLKPTVVNREDERNFLMELQRTALKEGLNYSMKDLINFHVSVKTNPLTIVGGISGMGKTELSRLYAKVMGLSESHGDFLFLPITPSYTDPDDLLGYLNVATGYYVPASTGLVDFLIHAEQNPDRLHMVSFDEMNLSQIEYWFAPFLSLLELKPQDRQLKLYAKDTFCRNYHKYPSQVTIGENVLFVGTVNLDETTKEFSDRLLDRVNLVTLQKERFAAFKSNSLSLTSETQRFTYDQFKSWINQTSGMESFSIEELEFFDELHAVINRYDAHKGVSYRLLNKIGCYINNLPSAEVNGVQLTRSEAIDLGIKQRLLTKIKGQQRQMGELVGVVYDVNEELEGSALLTLFQSQKAQAISSFEETQKEIKRKALELGIYGQTN